MTDMLPVIREATKAVPAVRYALGVAGVMAAFALGASFFQDVTVAFFSTLAMLALMLLLVLFARAATQGPSVLRSPATLLVWAVTVLFIASAALTVSAVFFSYPKPFPTLVSELFASGAASDRQESAPSPPENSNGGSSPPESQDAKEIYVEDFGNSPFSLWTYGYGGSLIFPYPVTRIKFIARQFTPVAGAAEIDVMVGGPDGTKINSFMLDHKSPVNVELDLTTASKEVLLLFRSGTSSLVNISSLEYHK